MTQPAPDLRDRIAAVLWPLTDWDGDQLNAEAAADAVLAVLPAPACPAAAPTDWIDGHPQLEAIAAAVYEQCETGDGGIVHDDPRNIAVAALAAVWSAPDQQAAVLHEAADNLAQMRIGAEDTNPDEHVRGYNNALDHAEAELRRLTGEAQHSCGNCEGIDPATCLTNPDRGREARQDPAPGGECGAREPEPRTGTSPCVLTAGHGGTKHQDKWTNQWPIDLVARSGQPETDARCPDAAWTGRPEQPHTWWQSQQHPKRPCPGVAEAD